MAKTMRTKKAAPDDLQEVPSGSLAEDGAMAKKRRAKKRNPQDATRRNVRSANKKIAHLEFRVDVLMTAVNALSDRVKAFERKRR